MDTNSQGDISSDSDILDGIIVVFCDQGEKENWEKYWAHYFFDRLSYSRLTFELYENQVWILPIINLLNIWIQLDSSLPHCRAAALPSPDQRLEGSRPRLNFLSHPLRWDSLLWGK